MSGSRVRLREFNLGFSNKKKFLIYIHQHHYATYTKYKRYATFTKYNNEHDAENTDIYV
jgi:hypothetical protein